MLGFEFILKEMLREIDDQSKPNKLTETNTHGAPPVHLSARNGYNEKLDGLLNAGANSNQPGDHFQNSLQAAPFCGYCDAACMLFDAGAGPGVTVGFLNAFDAAFAAGHEDAAYLLVERKLFRVMSAEGVLEEATRVGFDSVVRAIEKTEQIIPHEASNGALLELQTALQYDSSASAKLWLPKILKINDAAGFFGNAMRVAVSGGYR